MNTSIEFKIDYEKSLNKLSYLASVISVSIAAPFKRAMILN